MTSPPPGRNEGWSWSCFESAPSRMFRPLSTFSRLLKIILELDEISIILADNFEREDVAFRDFLRLGLSKLRDLVCDVLKFVSRQRGSKRGTIEPPRVRGKRIVTYLELCSKVALSDTDGSIRRAIFLSQSAQFHAD